MRIRKLLPALAFLLLLLAVGFGLNTYRDLGGFKSLELHPLETCRPILGVLSSEDITIDPDSGTAFISGADRRGAKGQRLPGAIYSYSLENQPVQPVNLISDLEFEFHPHGLAFHHGPDDRKSLFAVNHRVDRDTIEVFDITNSTLVHKNTLLGELLSNANDIVALDDNRFYVTRDHGYDSDWGRWLEELLRLRKSSVIYYDGAGFRIVAQGLAYANGVNLSPDGSILYVAATLEGKVLIFSRDPTDGDLDLVDEVVLNTAVDNIEVDDQGDLWIAAHPKVFDFLEYVRDPGALSPSQVLKVSFQNDGSYGIEEIHLSNGLYLSGSSVAARWEDYLLIGSVLDRRFLVCQLEKAVEIEEDEDNQPDQRSSGKEVSFSTPSDVTR